MSDRTHAPISEEIPRLLKEREVTLSTLADELGVSVSHLSRAIRGDRGKRLTPDLLAALATTLDLPPDYFVEYRELVVVAEIKVNPALRDAVYDGAIGELVLRSGGPSGEIVQGRSRAVRRRA